MVMVFLFFDYRIIFLSPIFLAREGYVALSSYALLSAFPLDGPILMPPNPYTHESAVRSFS